VLPTNFIPELWVPLLALENVGDVPLRALENIGGVSQRSDRCEKYAQWVHLFREG
jgi:hypothetical protein